MLSAARAEPCDARASPGSQCGLWRAWVEAETSRECIPDHAAEGSSLKNIFLYKLIVLQSHCLPGKILGEFPDAPLALGCILGMFRFALVSPGITHGCDKAKRSPQDRSRICLTEDYKGWQRVVPVLEHRHVANHNACAGGAMASRIVMLPTLFFIRLFSYSQLHSGLTSWRGKIL